MHEICKIYYENPRPTLDDTNRLIASSLSAITSPLRFGGSAPYANLGELVSNLVPTVTQRLKFIQVNLEQPKSNLSDQEIISEWAKQGCEK
jgi:hypothetical protein